LLKAYPDACVTIKNLGAKIAVALLERTDSLNDDERVAAPGPVAAASQKQVKVAEPEPENDTLARYAYSERTAGLYKLH